MRLNRHMLKETLNPFFLLVMDLLYPVQHSNGTLMTGRGTIRDFLLLLLLVCWHLKHDLQ